MVFSKEVHFWPILLVCVVPKTFLFLLFGPNCQTSTSFFLVLLSTLGKFTPLCCKTRNFSCFSGVWELNQSTRTVSDTFLVAQGLWRICSGWNGKSAFSMQFWNGASELFVAFWRQKMGLIETTEVPQLLVTNRGKERRRNFPLPCRALFQSPLFLS